MSRHFSINDLLSDQHYAEIMDLVQKRDTTVTGIWRWLRERGYKIGHSSVGRWLKMQREMAADPTINMRSELSLLASRMTTSQLTNLLDTARQYAPTERHV